MSKNLDETVRLQSQKGEEWIREIRGERIEGIAEGTSGAPRVASLSAASFPGRNKCAGTHCSLIEQEERENSSCQICQRVSGRKKDGGMYREARTERESDKREEKRNSKLVGAAKTSKEHAKWRRLQRKNLNKVGLMKRKEWPQCHRESSWQVRQSRLCQKEKKQSRQSRVPDRERGRVKVSESRTLRLKGRSER